MADTAVTWVLYTESQRVARPLYLLHANKVCQPRSDMTVTTWAHFGSLVAEKGWWREGVGAQVVVAPMVKRKEETGKRKSQFFGSFLASTATSTYLVVNGFIGVLRSETNADKQQQAHEKQRRGKYF